MCSVCCVTTREVDSVERTMRDSLVAPGEQVVRDMTTNQSRGFAFLTFKYAKSAAWAMANMDGMLGGRRFGEAPMVVGPSIRSQQQQEEEVRLC